jgi:hypothetical protein
LLDIHTYLLSLVILWSLLGINNIEVLETTTEG